ncbi:MAG: hypothetical protein EBR82_23460 [Caulobacteraceae bacterium]|nr:hypothetical protein [Caulobacteraceae bacterium]
MTKPKDKAAAVAPEQDLAPLPPQIVASLEAVKNGRFSGVTPLEQRITRLKPREQLTQERAAAQPQRVVGFLAGPSANETAMRERVVALRKLLAETAQRLDRGLAVAKEVIHELETLQGGEDAAAQEAFNLAAAKALTLELDAVLDKHAQS